MGRASKDGGQHALASRIAALTLAWFSFWDEKRIEETDVADAPRRRRALLIGVITAIEVSVQAGHVDAPLRTSNLPCNVRLRLRQRRAGFAKRNQDAGTQDNRGHGAPEIACENRDDDGPHDRAPPALGLHIIAHRVKWPHRNTGNPLNELDTRARLIDILVGKTDA